MVKLYSSNRSGQWKEFKEEDVSEAKANGWKELSSPKKSNKKKTKK
tara:strand:+ start:117 stop:254 length:138 start_codon:yes stop_codon:yes gene_type:complete